MTNLTRIPARAAYEAFMAGAPMVAWDQLDAFQQDQWSNVANAVAFALLHCDRESQGLKVGQKVVKDAGDYTFKGEIDVIFAKRSGAVRLVVEDQDGVLMIMSPKQVKPARVQYDT